MKNILTIDVETYSEIDIRDCGAYRYISDPSFELLMTGFAWNDMPAVVADHVLGGPPTEHLRACIYDPTVIKVAHNVAFEREVFHRVFGQVCPPEQWIDTMMLAAYCGLPLSLEGVTKSLGFAEDMQKDARGKRLIQYFSKPCKPTKANGGRTRNLPEHDMAAWLEYLEYNGQDVVAERAVYKRLIQHMPPDDEYRMWCLDQIINDRGVRIDIPFARAASAMGSQYKAEKTEEARVLTGLENPSSVSQVKAYIKEKEGFEVTSLEKKAAAEVKDKLTTAEASDLMALREEYSKSANKKYDAMLRSVCSDGHVKGCFQYGGTHTLRWAGRLVQLQNMKQNHIPDLDAARTLVGTGDMESVELLYGSVSDTLGQLTRTALIPEPGCRFVVSDFSAIEARVVAWMAQEQWVLDAFAAGKDIYCEVASQMFGVPVIKHGPNGELRQKGKIALLACIAEGQKVLTDRGLVPIEDVTTDMRVWDGESFVAHEGVIYKGEREVITYDGLTATPDHLVWIEGQQEPIRFGLAAARGARLVRSGHGGTPLWVGGDHLAGEAMEQNVEPLLRADTMYRMRSSGLDDSRKPDSRVVPWVSDVFSTEADTHVAGSPTDRGEAAVRESKGCKLRRLWRQRNPFLLSFRHSSGLVADRESRSPGQIAGAGQDRHQRQLRTGEHQIPVAQGQHSEQTVHRFVGIRSAILALCKGHRRPDAERRLDQRADYQCGETSGAGKTQGLEEHRRTARVYDIRNAGKHHRFTVSDCLTHNCGYGGGVTALKAFGADRMGMSEELQQEIVDKWRKSNPHIVSYWKRVERAAIAAVQGSTTTLGVLTFTYRDGTLWVRLPSGRSMAYAGARYAESTRKQGKTLSYMGVDQQTRRWVRVETWGGKLVENLVQAVARDILRDKMLALNALGYDIRAHVHDEVIISAPKSEPDACKQVSAIMGAELPWTHGLPLSAESYECEYYQKD